MKKELIVQLHISFEQCMRTETAGYDVSDHFLDSTKMVELGSEAQREIEDVIEPLPQRDLKSL